MIKKKLALLFITICFLLFEGCSYKKLDDALQGEINSLQNKADIASVPEIDIVDKKVGDDFIIKMDSPLTGSMKISLLQKQVFNSMEDSKIDLKECKISSVFEEDPERFMFFLLDIEIDNLDAEQLDGFDDELPFMISDYFPITEVHEENPELGKYNCEIVYFSDHPPITSTSTNYYHYNILPGQTLTYQIGIMAPKVDFENHNLWLSIGGGTGFFFELFDDEK